MSASSRPSAPWRVIPRGRVVLLVGLLVLVTLVPLVLLQRERIGVAVAVALAPTWPVPDVDLESMTPNVIDALSEARQAVVADPSSHAAWYDYAATLHAHSLHAQAIEAYGRAAALRPDDPRTSYLRAILLPGEGGETAAALALYERTAELDPHYPPVWIRMGQLHAGSGDAAAAIEAFEHAVELDPVYPMAHRELGLALLESGALSEALLHLKFAASLEENDYPTWAGLSRAYTQAGLQEEAAAAAERSLPLFEVSTYRDSVLDDALSRGVGPVRLERLADAYMRAGAWEPAVEMLKRVERDLPESASIQQKLSESYAAMGEAELADAHARREAQLRASGGVDEPAP